MGTPFGSIPRKLAVPLVALAAVGWLLVVIGFGIATNENDPPDLPRTGRGTYPLWMVTLLGPFIFIAAIAHAALWNLKSSIVGAITSFLSVVFLTALGMLLYVFGEIVRISDDHPDWVSLIFAGSLIATLFWTLLMVLWPFYDKSTPKDHVPFQGNARKIALILIILTGFTWFLVLVGFGIGSNSVDGPTGASIFEMTQIRNDPISYLYWAVCISGPFVLVAAVIHAALWNPISSIVGAVLAVFNSFFLTGLGMILFINGGIIRAGYDSHFNIPEFFELEFGGAFITTLLWIPVMMLWHFYSEEQE